MNIVIVVLVILAVLFTVAYFTKRRFGVLGLALTAGAMLSEMWAGTLTPYIEQAGLQVVAPPLETIVSSMLILLPAILLLFSGPTYSKVFQRIVGASMFSLLAAAFLLTPLGNALIITGDGRQVYDFMTDNRSYIITAGIMFALIDLLMVKTPKAKDKEK